MRCEYADAGCNYPEGECIKLCETKMDFTVGFLYEQVTKLRTQKRELQKHYEVMQVQRAELMSALKTAVERQGFTNEELIDARALIKRTYGSW